MKLFSMLVAAILAGAMMAGCADKDSHTETLRKYIAEHDIILIRRYNEYTLKYQR